MKLKYLIYYILLLSIISCTPKPKPLPPPPHNVHHDTPKVSKKDLQWSSEITFTDTGKYRSLLRDLRKCDPCIHYKGPLECKNFDNKADITLTFDKQELPSKVTLIIKPYDSSNRRRLLPWSGHWGACSPLLADPVAPIELTGTAKSYNNYLGFYIRLKQENSNASYIYIKSRRDIPLENDILNAEIYYGGATDGSEFGTMELENASSDNFYNEQNSGR